MTDIQTERIDCLYKKCDSQSRRLLEYNITIGFIVKEIARSRGESQENIETLRHRIMTIIYDGLF